MKRKRGFFLLLVLLVGLMIYLVITKEKEEKPILEPLQYIEEINNAAKEHNMDPFILAAVARVESSWDAKAESPVGARGLMQIMPETGVHLAGLRNLALTADELFDPKVSLDYGGYYLSTLWKQFKDWDLVFAAYNAGPNQVEQWLKDENVSKKGKLVAIPFEETKNYVEKVNYYISYYKDHYGNFPTEEESP